LLPAKALPKSLRYSPEGIQIAIRIREPRLERGSCRSRLAESVLCKKVPGYSGPDGPETSEILPASPQTGYLSQEAGQWAACLHEAWQLLFAPLHSPAVGYPWLSARHPPQPIPHPPPQQHGRENVMEKLSG